MYANDYTHVIHFLRYANNFLAFKLTTTIDSSIADDVLWHSILIFPIFQW